MPKLNDTQTLLLAHAAKRDDGSFYPLPATANGAAARATTAITALIKLGFAEEREVIDPAIVSRGDGDVRYGTLATAAGLAAIGIEDDDEERSPAPALNPAPATNPVTKSVQVLALLQRAEGATLAELIAVTGWLPHSTRAALTGLRKKGHVIDKTKRDDATCYRIGGAA